MSEDVLNLPPIKTECVNYRVDLAPEHVVAYNAMLGDARHLKMRIDSQGGRANAQELRRLMSFLQVLQQTIVSPLLADNGVAKFKSDTEMYARAAAEPTGALWALRAELLHLQGAGHRRIIVASNHVAIMRIAEAFLACSHSKGIFGHVIMCV